MEFFELYILVANWVGWPIVVLIMIAFVAYGHWILSNNISILQESNSFLSTQLEEAKEYRPDLLAERLAKRAKLLSEELEVLLSTEFEDKQRIKEKETELAIALKNISELELQLSQAQLNLFQYESIVSRTNLRHIFQYISLIKLDFELLKQLFDESSGIAARYANRFDVSISYIQNTFVRGMLKHVSERDNLIIDLIEPLANLDSDLGSFAKRYINDFHSEFKEVHSFYFFDLDHVPTDDVTKIALAKIKSFDYSEAIRLDSIFSELFFDLSNQQPELIKIYHSEQRKQEATKLSILGDG